MTRVYIVARRPAMRAGLRVLLAGGDIEVVGEAPNPAGLAGRRSTVDVVLLADEDLLDDTARALADDRTQALVVLADDDRPFAALAPLPLRGWAVLPADVPAATLQSAVQAAAQGLSVLPVALAQRFTGSRSAVEALNPNPLEESLTAREHEVLQLVSQGLSNKLIARELQISEHTVKFHISSLYTKLGASSRTEAVNRGARRGLITL